MYDNEIDDDDVTRYPLYIYVITCTQTLFIVIICLTCDDDKIQSAD